MDPSRRLWTALWIVLGITALPGPVWTQEPPAADEPAAVSVPEPEEPAGTDRRLVAAILATKPSTPLELVRAAKILADLDRPDLAKGFLKRVLDANLDPQQLVALEDALGATLFVQMASRADLAPEARQLSDSVLAAVRLHLEDPARLASLVKQLQDPSPDTRYRALVEIERARGAAVAPMVAVLADPGRAAEHANVRAALARLGPDAVDPLIALLESGDPKLVVDAIRVLGELQDEKAMVFLLAPSRSGQSDPAIRLAAEAALLKLTGRTPAPREAARLLVERAEEYFDRLQPLQEDVDGQVQLWSWDGQAKQLVAKSYLAHDASLVMASRLAREAYSVAPEDPKARLLHLATTLEQAAYANGLENPLPAAEGTPAGGTDRRLVVAAFGPEVVEGVLAYGLESGHAPAATAAARILGQTGKAEALLYHGAQPAPLAQATWHADRRVRFAAVEAILRLRPILPFPGSSRVTEALVYFASSGGAPRALVAGPSTAESQRVGGYLAALGYELETAVTGRDVVRRLLSSPDYELALVDATLQRPTVDFLLEELRHDCRTAGLPVGVIARSGQLERARHLAHRDPLAEAFSRAHTQEAVQWQVERLLDLVGRERVLPAERRHQTAQSLAWLADLSGQEQPIFDFRRAEEAASSALFVPSLAPDAVVVLGNLGTPESQRALVDLASRWTQPLELRLAAAGAFRRSIQHHGILLSTEQILLQYDRYNESERLDTGTQQVLGLILDSIEAPRTIAQSPLR